jgi:hypothetical protein
VSIAVHSLFHSSLLKTSHWSRFFEQPETPYKLLRAADPFLDAAIEIAVSAKAPPAAELGLHFTRTALGTIRDCLSIIHLFWTVIPSLYFGLKSFFDLAKGLNSSQPIPLNPRKPSSQLAYYEEAHGREEKLCAMGSVVSRLLQASAAIFCLGVSRPILYLQSKEISISPAASALARAHYPVQAAQHGAGLAVHIFELVYHSFVYRRAILKREDRQTADHIFFKNTLFHGSGCVEKILKCTYDLAKTLQPNLPPAVRIPSAAIIAGIGLYRTWLKTA